MSHMSSVRDRFLLVRPARPATHEGPTGSSSAIPGLCLVLAVAVLAFLAGRAANFVPDAVIALAIGTLIRNSVGLPSAAGAGVKFTQRFLLRAAIVLLGATISFGAIVGEGGTALPVILICLGVSFSLSLLVARALGLSARVGTLLGAGTGICGATAVMTVGPLIAATEAEMAYAIGTIFSYNAIAIVSYPFIGHLLHLSDAGFGTWSGTAVNDTSAVVATGLIYSTSAGQIATIVKLTRTVLLVPVAVGVGMLFGLRGDRPSGEKISVWKLIPWFVLGFLGMAVLNTLGAFPLPVRAGLGQVAQFLIVMVLAAVGLGMSFAQIRKLGARPLLSGLLVGMAMGVISLGLIYAFSIA